MNFSRISALAGRIVNQVRRDHRTLALIFVVPILVLGLLGYLMRSQESGTVRLGVASDDAGIAGVSAARRITDQLKQNPRLEVVELTRAEADSRVKDRTLNAAIHFPADFTQKLAAREQVKVELILEGSNPSQTGSVIPVLQGALLQAALSSGLGAPGAGVAAPPISVEPQLFYGSTDLTPIDYFAPLAIGFFAFFLVFLLTCISFLRERTQGTMERLAASPITRVELVLGYMLGFGLFALLQSTIIVLFTVYVLQVHYAGNLLWVFLVTLILAIGAVNLGIFLSTFARTELQAVQFIPLVIVPQVLLSGILFPVDSLPDWLQALSRLMPLTYAARALTDIMVRGLGIADTAVNFLVLLGFAAVLVLLASLTLRRQIA